MTNRRTLTAVAVSSGALASVTWRGGELLGEPDAGVITEGGPANFSLVHGDPLSDPTAMWHVWRIAE